MLPWVLFSSWVPSQRCTDVSSQQGLVTGFDCTLGVRDVDWREVMAVWGASSHSPNLAVRAKQELQE